MKKHIVVLEGDGIGPEIVAEGVKVLKAVEKRFGLDFTIEHKHFGGAAIDATGVPFPDETKNACKKADAILLGAVGGPKWDGLSGNIRPEAGLLAIRKEFNLFANLRPATIFPELAGLSSLRADIIAQGIDLLVVRELTGDVYFGQPAGEEVRDGVCYGFNNMIYSEEEVRRIAHVGFQAARARRKKLCSVDKANVLHSSKLWRRVVIDVHQEYQDVELSHMYVDNCAMQLVINPAQFDVILTGNIFGDILSDEAGAIVGSLGMLPSASISGSADNGAIGLYEPIHGSAPDIAGQDKANPLATILSVAMMLRTSFGHVHAAVAIESAVKAVLQEGYRTPDIAKTLADCKKVGCIRIGDLVAEKIMNDELPIHI